MLESSAPIPRNQDLQAAGRVQTCEGYPWLETPMLSLPVRTILTVSRTVGGAVTASRVFAAAPHNGEKMDMCCCFMLCCVVRKV